MSRYPTIFVVSYQYMHAVTSKARSIPPPCLDKRIYTTHRCSVIRHAINSYQPRTLGRHLGNPILMAAYSYVRLLLSGIQSRQFVQDTGFIIANITVC